MKKIVVLVLAMGLVASTAVLAGGGGEADMAKRHEAG